MCCINTLHIICCCPRPCSWLYLSRLAAIKEYAFMVALGEHGLPVPYAVAQNRHAVLMSLVDAVPLVQVGSSFLCWTYCSLRGAMQCVCWKECLMHAVLAYNPALRAAGA